MGQRVSVEHARGPRRDRSRERGGSRGDSRRRGGDSRAPWLDKYGPPTRTDYRVTVENLSTRVSWQVSVTQQPRLGHIFTNILFSYWSNVFISKVRWVWLRWLDEPLGHQNFSFLTISDENHLGRPPDSLSPDWRARTWRRLRVKILVSGSPWLCCIWLSSGRSDAIVPSYIWCSDVVWEMGDRRLHTIYVTLAAESTLF